MLAHSRFGATLTKTSTQGVAATVAKMQRSVSVHKDTVPPIYVSLAVLRRIRSRLTTITTAIQILLEQQDRIPYQRALATLATALALHLMNAMLSPYTVTVPERKDVTIIHQRSHLVTN
jgi:hypothetical protein